MQFKANDEYIGLFKKVISEILRLQKEKLKGTEDLKLQVTKLSRELEIERATVKLMNQKYEDSFAKISKSNEALLELQLEKEKLETALHIQNVELCNVKVSSATLETELQKEVQLLKQHSEELIANVRDEEKHAYAIKLKVRQRGLADIKRLICCGEFPGTTSTIGSASTRTSRKGNCYIQPLELL